MLLGHISLAASITQQSWRKGLRVSLTMLYQQASASPPSTHLRSFLLSSQNSERRWDNQSHPDLYPSHNFPLPQGKSFCLYLGPVGILEHKVVTHHLLVEYSLTKIQSDLHIHLVSVISSNIDIFHCENMKKVLVAPLCLTLCNPMDCSPPSSSVQGILQARILEWVAIPFSRDLPDPGVEPRSPTLQADYFIIWATREAP